ncbi:YciI family protein [Nonomuraea sp. SBT364]|uniref:YciI family protein n=1 Tax=Nonomuraea sp. SBT364 TaxID=1580530 RepID=UPI00066EB09C|nr:YciI family protein [Nonomuraea sp. SBT364]
MTRYAVLVFEAVAPADLPHEVQEAHLRVPERVAGRGGRLVAGLSLEQPETATAMRGGQVTDGPFTEEREALAGVLVIEARDHDHALSIAELVPVVRGGVEVRPLLGVLVPEEG